MFEIISFTRDENRIGLRVFKCSLLSGYLNETLALLCEILHQLLLARQFANLKLQLRSLNHVITKAVLITFHRLENHGTEVYCPNILISTKCPNISPNVRQQHGLTIRTCVVAFSWVSRLGVFWEILWWTMRVSVPSIAAVNLGAGPGR